MRRALIFVMFALASLGCDGPARYADPTRTFADAGARDGETFPVTLHVPRSTTAIEGTVLDPHGEPVEVRCVTCHAVLQPPPALPVSAQSIGGPHAGLRFEHGDNACASCHNPAHFDRLRLATGESIAMTDAFRLCGQCHGPQRRDWEHGAHGGMNGHWDLHRGPRVRNHCIDCHDPHAPRFPRFMPMPPPRDVAHGAPHGAPHGASHE